MSRSCIFCGAKPTTKEHVWPAWLRRLVGKPPASAHQQTLEHEGQPAVVREFNLPPFDLRANVVCGPCNHGWMSDLEGKVEAILLPMLQVRGRELHRGGQETLAAWALMKAMVFEYTNPAKARAIPQLHRDYLREELRPPPGVWVWLATYNAAHPGRYFNSAMAIGDAETGKPPERNVNSSTFTLGPVVLQVFGSTHEEISEAEFDFKLPGVIHQIWPYKESITWMPGTAFDDHTLEEFATRIHDELLSMTKQGP